MSVARVAQAEGVNSHQVFQGRVTFRAGCLMEPSKKTAELLAVTLTAEDVTQAPLNRLRAGLVCATFPVQESKRVEMRATFVG